MHLEFFVLELIKGIDTQKD